MGGVRHRVKYGLDYFLDHFLDQCLDQCLNQFLDHFIGGEHALVLREGGMQSISTKGGVGGRELLLRELVRDRLLLHSEGWEVVVIINTTD